MVVPGGMHRLNWTHAEEVNRRAIKGGSQFSNPFTFVPEQDEVVNPLGAKGLGELGIVGVAAAIANAVFHATGKRIRDLPITLDKLL